MTRGISFHPQDDCGLFTEDKKIPYVSIRLTTEQMKAIKGKLPGIYETDGKTVFDVRGKDGNLTGEKFVYVIFI